MPTQAVSFPPENIFKFFQNATPPISWQSYTNGSQLTDTYAVTLQEGAESAAAPIIVEFVEKRPNQLPPGRTKHKIIPRFTESGLQQRPDIVIASDLARHLHVKLNLPASEYDAYMNRILIMLREKGAIKAWENPSNSQFKVKSRQDVTVEFYFRIPGDTTLHKWNTISALNNNNLLRTPGEIEEDILAKIDTAELLHHPKYKEEHDTVRRDIVSSMLCMIGNLSNIQILSSWFCDDEDFPQDLIAYVKENIDVIIQTPRGHYFICITNTIPPRNSGPTKYLDGRKLFPVLSGVAELIKILRSKPSQTT